MFYNIGTRFQRYKTNTTVIYCCLWLITTVHYITLILPWNGSKLLQYFNPRKSRIKITMVNDQGFVLQQWYLQEPML